MYDQYDPNRNHNPYEPYDSYNHTPRPPKRRRKAWIIVLAVISAVFLVSVVSIQSYRLVTNYSQKHPGVLEWDGDEPAKDSAEAPNPPDSDDPAELPASGPGASQEYALDSHSSSGLVSRSPEAVAEAVTPSVVCIQNYQSVTYQSAGQRGFGWNSYFSASPQDLRTEMVLASEGSGIILTEDGYIATNAHVVASSEVLKVVLSNEEICEAKLIGTDPDTDLAVIKIEKNGLTPASLGNSEELKVGQYVMAVGNPGGLEFSSSVTLGIVSATNRPLQLKKNGYTMNTIQTDAAINPGNSGGALVNMNGQIVGINSAKYVSDGYEGLGFAISINEALPIIKDLMDYGSVQNRAMLGVNGTMVDSVTAKYNDLQPGFYVYSVTNSKAGSLQAGDVIVKINDTSVIAEADIKNAIKNLHPGDTVKLEYFRSSDNKTYSTELTLTEYVQAND